MKVLPIVVVDYKAPDYTAQCIDSIIANVSIPFHIIVVNNGSGIDTKKVLEEKYLNNTNITIINLDKNTGFAGGYNTGIRYAQEHLDFDHLFIVNNDTIVPKGSIESMLGAFKSAESLGFTQVGMIGPVSNSISGRQQIEVVGASTPHDINVFQEELLKSNKQVSLTGFLVGFAIMFKREVLESVGLFDERFELGNFEDYDYAVRARKEGWLSFIDTKAFIYHYGSITVKEVEKTEGSLFHKNYQILLDKYKDTNHKKIVGICRVKNGELYLYETLEAISRMCDNIIVFDDHSTDSTKEICEQFPKVTYIYSPFKEFNEAIDRNYLIDKAMELNPDFIWVADADEIPEEQLILNIQDMLREAMPLNKLFIFKICNFWNSPKTLRTDGLWGGFYQGRLFKAEKNSRIVVSEEGLHSGAHPAFPPENVVMTRFRIKHYGNMHKKVRRDKYAWYTKTDTNKDVNSILGNWKDFYRSKYGYKDELLKDEDYYRHIVDETDMVLTPWIEHNTLSICIIANNEEEYIEKTLKSTRSIADETIVVLDTRSTDKTEEICNKYGVKVFRYKWNSTGFSGARNYALSKASCSWVLQIDADEELPDGMQKVILDAIQNANITAYMCSFRNIQDKSGKAWEISESLRLFQNKPYLYFSGKVHEDLAPSVEAAISFTKPVVSSLPGYFINNGYVKDPTVVAEKHEQYAKYALATLEEDDNDFRAHLNYATHLLHVDNLDEAEKHFKRSMDLNPNVHLTHEGLAAVYYKKALSTEYLALAQNSLQKAISTSMQDRLCHKEKKEKIFRNFKMICDLMNSVKG